MVISLLLLRGIFIIITGSVRELHVTGPHPIIEISFLPSPTVITLISSELAEKLRLEALSWYYIRFAPTVSIS